VNVAVVLALVVHVIVLVARQVLQLGVFDEPLVERVLAGWLAIATN
jgi:hypothetical protein